MADWSLWPPASSHRDRDGQQSCSLSLKKEAGKSRTTVQASWSVVLVDGDRTAEKVACHGGSEVTQPHHSGNGQGHTAGFTCLLLFTCGVCERHTFLPWLPITAGLCKALFCLAQSWSTSRMPDLAGKRNARTGTVWLVGECGRARLLRPHWLMTRRTVNPNTWGHLVYRSEQK